MSDEAVNPIPLDVQELELDLLEPLRYDERFLNLVEFIEWISTWGYVAGGFPAWLARLKFVPYFHYLDDSDSHSFNRDIKLNRSAMMQKFYNDHTSPLLAGLNSDIDVFFENLEDLGVALTMLLRKSEYRTIEIKESKMGFAHEINIPLGKSTSAQVRVQLIKSYMGPPKNMIKDFDILNAMVGYRRHRGTHQAWIHRNWKELEENRTVHTYRWNSPMVIKRIKKYLRSKGYKYLTPETSLGIVAAAGIFIEDIKSGKLDSSKFPSLRNFGNYLLQMSNHFSIDQLLSLSMIQIDMGENDYSNLGSHKANRSFHQRVIKEVIKRGIKDKEKRAEKD